MRFHRRVEFRPLRRLHPLSLDDALRGDRQWRENGQNRNTGQGEAGRGAE